MDIRPNTTNRRELLKVSNEKILRERKKQNKRFGVIFSISLILLFIGIIFFLRIKSFQLSSINIEGNVVLESKDIENFINKKYEGKYLWVIPKNNTIFVLPNTIKKSLQKEFPKIDYLEVKRSFPNKLSISLSERKGSYVWCGNDVTISVISKDNQCFFVDKEGVIFSEAPYFSGTPFVLFLGGEKNKDQILGTQLLNQNDFKNIILIYDVISKLKLSPYAVLVLPDGEYEILLRDGQYNFLNSPRIKLKDINDQIIISQNLAAALNTKIFKENKISDFSYIDLRFGNKVFYKLK